MRKVTHNENENVKVFTVYPRAGPIQDSVFIDNSCNSWLTRGFIITFRDPSINTKLSIFISSGARITYYIYIINWLLLARAKIRDSRFTQESFWLIHFFAETLLLIFIFIYSSLCLSRFLYSHVLVIQ